MTRKPIVAALLAVALVAPLLRRRLRKQDAAEVVLAMAGRREASGPSPSRRSHRAGRSPARRHRTRRRDRTPSAVGQDRELAGRPAPDRPELAPTSCTRRSAEGGITRFNCIFHSNVPKIVGPVRSARLSDLWIVPQYHALFVFSGAQLRSSARSTRPSLPNLSQDAGVIGAVLAQLRTLRAAQPLPRH